MPLLERWTPMRELELMDRRMRRFFEGLGFMPVLTPAADVYETDDELVVELEVPGFEEKQLEIEVFDHTLRVKGERREETEKKAKALHLSERLEKEFERRFELPYDVDSEHVRATYTNGVLVLHVPKAEAVKPRKVQITKR